MIVVAWRSLLHGAGFLRSRTVGGQRSLTVRPGLFNVPGLGQPTGFRDLVHRSITQCRSCIDLLSLTQHSVESLRLVDQISDEICRVLDVSELVRCVHPQDIWRNEAQLANEQMSTFMTELNCHPKIYSCLVGIRKSMFAYLNPEQRQLVSSLLTDMLHSGIELSPDIRHRLAALQTKIFKLENQFYCNISNASFESRVVFHKKHLIPPIPLRSESEYVCLSPANAEILLSNCTDEMTRRSIYMEMKTQARDNVPVLDSLVTCRNEYSMALGYSSYAAMKLSSSLIQSSHRATAFLTELSARLRSKADAELKLLESARNQRNGRIDAWDVPFYTNEARRRLGLVLAQVPSISLDRFLAGLGAIVANLFGIQIKRSPLNHTESHSLRDHVQKCIFLDCKSNQIGTLYLDLYARPDKYSSPAQFTIQNPSPGVIASTAIVCSFDPISRRLRHSDCATLFHEFGHALHLILSGSAYSHLAGTRGPSDFVEIASHLLERFVWDYRIWSMISGQSVGAARNHLQKLHSSKNLFFALETQSHISYSLMDQYLFGSLDVSPPDWTRVWSEIHNNHMSYRFVEGTHPHTTFSHFCGYSATYYSYLYSRLLASHIWEEFFQTDPLAAQAGRRFRDRFIAPGLGRNPKDILNNMLDNARQPSIEVFLRQEMAF